MRQDGLLDAGALHGLTPVCPFDVTATADTDGSPLPSIRLTQTSGTLFIGCPSLAANLVGAIVKDPVQDKVVLQEYLETVVRERKEWGDLYGAIREVL